MGAASADTVTFLFTDIEGSTRLWREHPATMPDALARHDAIARATIADGGGRLFKHTGDGVCAAFAEYVSTIRYARTASGTWLRSQGRRTVAGAPSGAVVRVTVKP